jgi:DNA phosphorothioation-dependent restriction protein DptG
MRRYPVSIDERNVLKVLNVHVEQENASKNAFFVFHTKNAKKRQKMAKQAAKKRQKRSRQNVFPVFFAKSFRTPYKTRFLCRGVPFSPSVPAS